MASAKDCRSVTVRHGKHPVAIEHPSDPFVGDTVAAYVSHGSGAANDT
ncbi:MAG: hypothetical protein WA285_07925 [Mycobacterium sp.]